MSRRRAAFVSCLTLALGGCLVGPDFKPPAPPDVDAYRTPESPAQKAESDTDAAQRIALGQRIPAQWWALFHSSRLDETLRQAIAASYTLAAAKATLAQVQEAIVELLDQMPAPDVIVHSTSSGGTQAGIIAACRLLGLSTRVVGISADDPAKSIQAQVRTIVSGIGEVVDLDGAAERALARGTAIEIDDRFVGDGYAVPTAASQEALQLSARTEALFLDPTYTAKAMAALIAYVRQQRFKEGQTVLFWHTGGQVGLFA